MMDIPRYVVTISRSTLWVSRYCLLGLPVLLQVAPVSPGDFLGRDLIWLAQLQGIKDRAGHVLDHHGRLDGCLGRFPNGENPVIFHQDGWTGADGADDFLADLVTPNFSIS